MPETQRTVVITGASSGFGASAVSTFADRGFGTMRDANGGNAQKKAELDAYLSLADAEPSKRPTRSVVGITRGVDEVNAFTQSRQDALLKEMQLDGVLGGADA